MNNSTTALTIFNFEGMAIQPILIDGVLHWIATEICKALGIVNVSDAIQKLDDDEKLVSLLPIAGQNRNALCVNESGLYHLIFQSRKPEAQRFRRWVTGEVLPAIRKTGSYNPSGQLDTTEQRMTQLEQRITALEQTKQLPTKRIPRKRHQFRTKPQNEKEMILYYVLHRWDLYQDETTATMIRSAYLKHLTKEQILAHLELLKQEEKVEHIYTPHTLPYGGKFRPVTIATE